MLSSLKTALIFLMAFFCTVISSIHAQPVKTNNIKIEAIQLTNPKAWSSFSRSPLKQKIKVTEGLQGSHNYIVRLTDEPVATYRGGVPGYKATAAGYVQNYTTRKKTISTSKISQQRNSLKLDLESGEVKQYRTYLKLQQDNFLQRSSEVLGFKPATSYRLQLAFNGLVMRMTQEDAKQIAAMKEVSYVEREQILQLDTDTGPRMIGAGSVWDGSATGVAHRGEGIIVGIIDTGINTDHPSFAAEAADGYVHTNPFGDGVYVGDCANGFPELCNSKLIGVRSYTTITDIYQDDTVFGPTPPAANGEDYNGHGSHVSSTAAGNTLYNVDLISTEFGVEESDGIVSASGFQFTEISGVAPRANLISYQVCAPGDSSDTHSGCYNSPMLQSVDDAIDDGVDVLNMSISGGGNPWSYSMAQVFLAAQDAGIFVAISAGNSGPDISTTEKSAPWYTSVAASTHNRIINKNDKQIHNFMGGDTPAPGTIAGRSDTGAITATIVYAGDHPINLEDSDTAAQCLVPYPAGTFNGEIVLCDRGDIARVEKASNVAAGGAGGFVLANLQGGDANLVPDAYVVPGIHVSADDGDAIKTWLKTGTGHTASITGITVSTSVGQADMLASFSSRGPNLDVPNIMAPTVAAPGVSIYAAYSDQQFGHDVSGSAPADFDFLQGTSMASPHVTGAGALLKSVHPEWTPDNIRSALMMTAERNMVKEDGSTSADIFDMGSGRIQVGLAAQTGLVMDETSTNYNNANPATGGDPKTLNIPSMGNTECESVCGWSRTLTATRSSTWTISTTSNNDNIEFSVSPAQFSITEGNDQIIEVTASSNRARTGEQAMGWVTLTSENADIPEVHLPVYVSVYTSNLPVRVDLDVLRDAGSTLLSNIEAIEITNLTTQVRGLNKATITEVSLQEDSNNATPFENLNDGVTQYIISLPEDSPFLWADLSEATARDMDLFIGKDDNNNGLAEESEMLCASVSYTSQEECLIESVLAGDYWILVHNYSASEPGATDTVKLRNAYVPSADNNNLAINGPVDVPAATPFDLRLAWNDDMTTGDSFIGAFELFTTDDPATAYSLGQTLVIINREDDDVLISLSDDNPDTGDRVTMTLEVTPNYTTDAIDYQIDLIVPNGLSIDPSTIVASDNSSVSQSAVSGGTQLSWNPTRLAYNMADNNYIESTSDADPNCAAPDLGQTGNYVNLADSEIDPLSFYGDEIIGQVVVPLKFLGEGYESFYITDNGIITLAPVSSFVHQKTPSITAPNSVLAPFWRDFQLDEANGSGISIASAGNWSIVEFDSMHHFSFYNGNPEVDDSLDFEILNNTETGDILYIYNNVNHNPIYGDTLGATVGWENADGTIGDHYVYVAGPHDLGLVDVGSVTQIVDDLVVCYRAVEPLSVSPLTLTLEASVNTTAAGQTLEGQIHTQVSVQDSQPDTYIYTMDIQSNLSIDDPGVLSVDEDSSLTGITVTFTDKDANPNLFEVVSDSGTIANLSNTDSDFTFDLIPDADFNGDITVITTVTDTVNAVDTTSLDFVVQVVPVNDAPVVTASYSLNQSTLTLTADASDIENDTLTFSWEQNSGPTVSIANANSATASVSNANATTGTLTFQVTVSDASLSATDNISVSVTAPTTPPANGGGGGGGSTGHMFILLLSMAIYWRRRQLFG